MNGNKIGPRSFPRGSFRFDKSAGRIAFPYRERVCFSTSVEDFLGNACPPRMDAVCIHVHTSLISMAGIIISIESARYSLLLWIIFDRIREIISRKRFLNFQSFLVLPLLLFYFLYSVKQASQIIIILTLDALPQILSKRTRV